MAQNLATTGGELIETLDSNRQERALPVYGLLGLLSGDVTVIAGTTGTISTRLTHCTSTSAVTLTLPSATGNLRQVNILKTGANNVTVNAAGAEVIVAATATDTSVTVATTKAVQLLSDGTKWYHVSNDA